MEGRRSVKRGSVRERLEEEWEGGGEAWKGEMSKRWRKESENVRT